MTDNMAIAGDAELSSPEHLLDDVDIDKLSTPLTGLLGVVDKHPKTAAVILAGGNGERFGREGGKQLAELLGKPVLTWSVAAFEAVGDVGVIVVACPKERQEEYWEKAIEPYGFITPIIMAASGPSRQESCFSGLELVPDDCEFVIMHDGARPILSPELVLHTINTVKGNLDCDGAVVAHPAVDTLKVVENGVVMGTPDRRVFWNAQTPQVFRTGIIRRAYASALRDGFMGTDDSALIERLGGRVLVVEGPRDNMKLTAPEDLPMMEAALKALHGLR